LGALRAVQGDVVVLAVPFGQRSVSLGKLLSGLVVLLEQMAEVHPYLGCLLLCCRVTRSWGRGHHHPPLQEVWVVGVHPFVELTLQLEAS
jgi:hypothetical protein